MSQNKSKPESKSRMPVIDQAKCNGCGLCVTVCTCHALIIRDNVITAIETDNCGWCGNCEAVCETGAITCPFDIVCEDDSAD